MAMGWLKNRAIRLALVIRDCSVLKFVIATFKLGAGVHKSSSGEFPYWQLAHQIIV